MLRKKTLCCAFLLISTVFGAVIDVSKQDQIEKAQEKKPPIVKDFVCLRDGELCHPLHSTNRGLYVSCSNGVAWEQSCAKCAYHPVSCPTKSLWFDGEKCEWASPELARLSCVDKFPVFDAHHLNSSTHHKEYPQMQMVPLPLEQDSLIQNLQALNPPSPQVQVPSMGSSLKEQFQIQSEKGKWPVPNVNSFSAPAPSSPTHNKSPKRASDADESDNLQEVQENDDVSEQQEKKSSIYDFYSDFGEVKPVSSTKRLYATLSRRKAAASEPEAKPVAPAAAVAAADEEEAAIEDAYFPSEGNLVGSRIVKINDPVFGLVDSPEGNGKQILVRVSQPFVFEDSARSILPILNAPNF